MARLTIDTGTLGNTATGDSLRGAMEKINANFNELYDSDLLALSNGLIKTQTTNGDIKIQPNGVGAVEIDRLLIDGDNITSLVTNASINITGNGTGGVEIEGILFKNNTLSAPDSTLITINDGFTVGLDGVAITGILDEDNMSSNSASALATQQSIKAYVDAQNTAQALTFAGDDSTGTAVNTGETFKFAGTQNITTAVSGDTLTITGPNLSTYLQNTGPQTIDGLTFDDNKISANASNSDLDLSGSGTGTVTISGLSFPTLDGSDGQFLTTDGAGNLSFTTITIEFDGKATEAISKGEAVYISGISGNTPTVSLARANSTSTMPAFGIAAEDISLNATGKISSSGSIRGLNVADFGETGITFSIGDTVYISSVEAGKLTNVPPVGEANFIENIGKIERHTPTNNMTIHLIGSGRSNATPALNNGNIFIGNGSNQSSTASLDTSVSNLGYIKNTGTQTIDNLSFNDNIISTSSNADLELTPGGTGNVAVTRPLVMASFTTTQRNALTAANGMMIYNTTTNQFEGYENGAWISLKADTADAG